MVSATSQPAMTGGAQMVEIELQYLGIYKSICGV